MKTAHLTAHLAAVLVIAAASTGCSALEVNEAICSKGEEPTWAVTNTSGAMCVRDGAEPQAGFARYPRGRVPVWINPPDGYAHRTEDGHDLYNVNPNDPDYPWWDEVLAEHPELGCAGASEPLAAIAMTPRGKRSPRVTVLLNSVGNRCFRFDWPDAAEKAVDSDLSVRESPDGPVWSSGKDVASGELLRVGSDTCLHVTASLQLRDGTGTTTYRLDQAEVPHTCEDQ